ncbi:MAG: hypothetical protein HON92_11170, partial [Planctomycetaceae bacterium]|nr:hypothetical protein [Planctomycetaceae bacterium]
IQIPADLNRSEIEEHRFDVQELLESRTQIAQRWAQSKMRLCDELPLAKDPAPLGILDEQS